MVMRFWQPMRMGWKKLPVPPVCPTYRASYKIAGSAERAQARCKNASFLKKPNMKIHEYQAKTILAKYGVAVPRGEMALTRAEAGEGRASPF